MSSGLCGVSEIGKRNPAGHASLRDTKSAGPSGPSRPGRRSQLYGRWRPGHRRRLACRGRCGIVPTRQHGPPPATPCAVGSAVASYGVTVTATSATLYWLLVSPTRLRLRPSGPVPGEPPTKGPTDLIVPRSIDQ